MLRWSSNLEVIHDPKRPRTDDNPTCVSKYMLSGLMIGGMPKR
jgi:hypothetical protein